MTVPKRALADASTTGHKSHDPTPTEPPTTPLNSKPGFILKLSLLLLSPYLYLIFHHYKIERYIKKSILVNAGVSLAGFFVTRKMIPVASKYDLKRNLFGYDTNQRGTYGGTLKVSESLGIVVGIVFLVLAILFQYSNFTSDSNWLVKYNATLASICFMTLLGFVDDVHDVPWRVKLLMPSFATLPLLMAYAGHTTIVIPKPLIPYNVERVFIGIHGHFFCLGLYKKAMYPTRLIFHRYPWVNLRCFQSVVETDPFTHSTSQF